jgi:hypothetical protein
VIVAVPVALREETETVTVMLTELTVRPQADACALNMVSASLCATAAVFLMSLFAVATSSAASSLALAGTASE